MSFSEPQALPVHPLEGSCVRSSCYNGDLQILGFRTPMGLGGYERKGLPDPFSASCPQKSTTRERSNHQRHLTSSGGWVPIKGESGVPYLSFLSPSPSSQNPLGW